MAVASTRVITITYAGDLVASLAFNAAGNAVCPGDIDIFTLSAGNNSIPLPTGGSTPAGATIIPPNGNTQALILKGVNADTGIQLHKTDPTSITFDPAALPANFVINAAGTVTGLRVVWT